ncbi:hypothetical protein LIA77_00080 [Sarocladium implicatum]|nr:hypothetical protein LIA77_00080 [Sarocladium implicatum]
MSVQKTFTIVPTVSRDASSPMPAFVGGRMTSKQVKQAYKTANKAPRLSRAEQIKADRAEQQRIRKELEKEKASAKAKLLREKKKEKELAEREAKKKEGKPLVNVRPSQDTIARFVRGNGANRKSDSAGICVDRQMPAAHGPGEVADGSLRTSHLLESISEDEEEEVDEGSKDPAGPPQGSGLQEETTADNGPVDGEEDSNTVLAEISTGDIQSDLFNESGSARSQSHTQSQREEPKQHPPEDDTIIGLLDEELHTDLSQDAPTAVPLQQEPRVEASNQAPTIPQVEEFLDGELDSDILDELVVMMDTSQGANIYPLKEGPGGFGAPGRAEPRISAPQPSASIVRREEATDIRAQEESAVTVCAPEGQAPSVRDQESGAPSIPTNTHQSPPLGTQAIIMNLDDFFPTSSQQARELEFDTDDLDTLLSSLPDPQAMPPPATPARALPEVSTVTAGIPTAAVQKGISPKPQTSQLRQSPSPSPQRWFTASGSKELNSLAIQRSKRTAALEEIQQRERMRAAQWLPAQGYHARAHTHVVPSQAACQAQVEEPSPKRTCLPEGVENTPPKPSQETDYGGGWMEDFEF